MALRSALSVRGREIVRMVKLAAYLDMASNDAMHKDHRSAVWFSALLGLAAVSLLAGRKRSNPDGARHWRGKVVLITGGARGLGFAVAMELAAMGVKLVLTSRDRAELNRAKARLVDGGLLLPEDVFVQAADVSIADEIREVVRAAKVQFGQIDIVINNAGIILVGPLENQTLASFHEAMNINFFGALHTTLAVLPEMLARGEGTIVNIASIGGKVAFPHLLPYVASKFALVGWSQGLRAELSQTGIHVTTVTPGIMRTGSHIQARYAGNKQKEYRWFAAAASFPGTATNATSAARKIVKAIRKNWAEVSIGLQAVAAARFSNLEPELTATLLSLANRLLPKAQGTAAEARFWGADQSAKGKAYRGSLPAFLERTGSTAISQYNQG